MNLETAEKANESIPERKSKASKKAPCVVEVWSDVFNRDVPVYPAVNCCYECSSCGWNPDVAQRRVEKMREELKKKGR